MKPTFQESNSVEVKELLFQKDSFFSPCLSSPYPFLKPFSSFFTPPTNLCPLPCQLKPVVRCSVTQRWQRRGTTCSLCHPFLHLMISLLNWMKPLQWQAASRSAPCYRLSSHHMGSCLTYCMQLSTQYPGLKVSVQQPAAALLLFLLHNLNYGSRAKGAHALLEIPFTSSSNLFILQKTLQAKSLGVPHPRTRRQGFIEVGCGGSEKQIHVMMPHTDGFRAWGCLSKHQHNSFWPGCYRFYSTCMQLCNTKRGISHVIRIQEGSYTLGSFYKRHYLYNRVLL